MPAKLGLIWGAVFILILAGCTDPVEVGFEKCQLSNCGHATENPTCSREPYGNCPTISYYEDVCTKFLNCHSTSRGCLIEIIGPEYSPCYDCFKACKGMTTTDEQLDCNQQCKELFEVD